MDPKADHFLDCWNSHSLGIVSNMHLAALNQ
jgi:hypothetical protein